MSERPPFVNSWREKMSDTVVGRGMIVDPKPTVEQCNGSVCSILLYSGMRLEEINQAALLSLQPMYKIDQTRRSQVLKMAT